VQFPSWFRRKAPAAAPATAAPAVRPGTTTRGATAGPPALIPAQPSLAASFADMRADYDAAKTSRFHRDRPGVSTYGTTGDYHVRYESDYLKAMELVRDIMRNDPVVPQAIRRVVDNVVQGGYTLDPQTGDTALDADLAARWQDWADDERQCDIGHRFNWHQFERLALQQTLVDGDCFFLPHKSGALQAVEAHRCRTPDDAVWQINAESKSRAVVHGVLIDSVRRPLQYWFTKDEIQPWDMFSHSRDARKYNARDGQGNRQVFHVYRPDRFSMTRGITILAPVTDAVGMHADIQFAMLVQRQIVSCFGIIRERQAGFNPAMSEPPPLGERETDTLTDGETAHIEGIAPGMILEGMPGEVLRSLDVNIPNPEFFDHARMILQFIATNLGIPVEVLLLDPRETNFSGWRGAIDQARMGFRELQSWLVSRLHRPTYRWRLRWLIADDPAMRRAAARLGDRFFAHRFNLPAWAYIEPAKDAQADLVRVSNGLISQRRRCSERGYAWEDVSAEIVNDNAAHIERAYEKAAELTKKYPDLQLDWRELAAMPGGGAPAPSLDTGADDDKPVDQGGKNADDD